MEAAFSELRLSVLSAFKDDSLKTKAANFILEHLHHHEHVAGEIINVYTDTIQKYASDSELQLAALTSLKDKQTSLAKRNEKDVLHVTSGYLIHHINIAVDNYQKYKWDREISFEEFSQYILPYKIHTESTSDWISYFHKEYFHDNDSSILHQDMKGRALLVAAWLKKRKEKFKIKTLNIPEVPVETADKLFYGTCHELTKVNVSAFRAFGIPVVCDFTPVYSNRNGEHEWTTIMHHDSVNVINIATIKIEMDVDTSERYFSRVYRKYFQKVNDNHFSKRGYRTFAPDHLNDPYLKDVTNNYSKTFDIDLPVPPGSTDSAGYLDIFSYQSWLPVTWGEVDRHVVHYKNLRGNTTYLPIFPGLEGDKAFGTAFFLTSSGEVQFMLADSLHLEKVSLERKYPFFKKIQVYVDRMIGGRFEGSDEPSFKSPQLLHAIVSNPGANYNYVPLKNKRKYRYVRYIGPPRSQCNVAEIEFYATKDTVPLQGRTIGTEGAFENDSTRDINAALDENPLTFFDYKNRDSVCWVGLDLSSAKTIAAIRFLARTDVNIVVKDNEYELFYWQNGWRSLGKKIAQTTKLEYDNVPAHALLLLRNLTSGAEERIFQYENGKQVWR